MSYFRTCPDCGANLDPDERCDCHKKPIEESIEENEFIDDEEK